MLAKSLAGQIASAEFWTAVSWKENFSGGGAMHLRGKSVSILDVRVGKWKQTWVDNEGGYLDFGGESKDGQTDSFTRSHSSRWHQVAATHGLT
jgi:hypothetical protein